jgi:hypothetical protein
MKKFLFVGLITIFSACQDSGIQKKQTDYKELATNLEITYTSAFTVALKSTPKNVYSDTYNHLKQNFFKGDFQFNPNELRALASSGSRITSAGDLDLSFLTAEQKSLAVPFFDGVLSLTDISAVNSITDKFSSDIALSSLTEEQKYQLLSISAAVKVGAKFIQESIAKDSANGRSAKIDIKDALQDGVIGLGLGAARGCWIGATGGTVAFPGLGTATGCVGGAVMLGAVGFIGGVATSLLKQSIFG